MTIDISDEFIAKYRGRCTLDACEHHHGDIDPGDLCCFVDGEIHHSRCAKRVQRGQSDPLCPTCWTYHRGACA